MFELLGLIFATIVALLGLWWSSRGGGSATPPDLPVFEAEKDAKSVMEKACTQYPTDPFVMSMLGMKCYILPTSEIDRVRSVPETKLSIKRHHYNVFLGEYTYMGTKADEFDMAMRHTLTRKTPVVLEAFTEEMSHAMESSLAPMTHQEWQKVRVRATFSRVASLLSSRAFVGLPLSRDPEWIEATTRYTQDVTMAWFLLRRIPHWLRPLVAPLLPPVRSLMSHRRITVEKLRPLLDQKKQQWGNTADRTTVIDRDDGDTSESMIDWFIAHYKDGPPTVDELARDQLLATFASIYNLTNALSCMVFDLAANPHCADDLRAELDNTLGTGSSKLDKHALPKLRLMDSFLRESQRLSPASLANIPRIVTDPSGFETSSNHTIPHGATVMVRAHPINRSQEMWGKDADKFVADRFLRLREQKGNELRYQHTSTGKDNINFGHGTWACPGRFFASAQLKAVLAHLVRNYDVQCVPDRGRPGQLHFGLAVMPDPEGEVLFRRRVNNASS